MTSTYETEEMDPYLHKQRKLENSAVHVRKEKTEYLSVSVQKGKTRKLTSTCTNREN